MVQPSSERTESVRLCVEPVRTQLQGNKRLDHIFTKSRCANAERQPTSMGSTMVALLYCAFTRLLEHMRSCAHNLSYPTRKVNTQKKHENEAPSEYTAKRSAQQVKQLRQQSSQTVVARRLAARLTPAMFLMNTDVWHVQARGCGAGA